MVSVRFKKKVILVIVAFATILSLWYDSEVTVGIIKALKSRKLAMSLNLGDGKCEWRAALQYRDPGFPSDQEFTKTIVAGKFQLAYYGRWMRAFHPCHLCLHEPLSLTSSNHPPIL